MASTWDEVKTVSTRCAPLSTNAYPLHEACTVLEGKAVVVRNAHLSFTFQTGISTQAPVLAPGGTPRVSQFRSRFRLRFLAPRYYRQTVRGAMGRNAALIRRPVVHLYVLDTGLQLGAAANRLARQLRSAKNPSRIKAMGDTRGTHFSSQW